MVENFAPSPMVTWKVKNAASELDDIAKEISRQNVEVATWLPFDAYSKI